jgi:hypothetical protein
MRRNGQGPEVGIAFWFLVAAFMALMMGRARAAEPVPAEPAPAAQVPAVPAPPAASAPSALITTPAPGLSAVDVAAKTFRGQVVFSDVLIAPAADFPSGDAMVGALQRLKRSTVQGTEGFWRMHMVAFPSPVPPGGTYRLRATDTTNPKARKQVKVFEIGAQAGQPELEVKDLVLTDVMGFKPGHSYEIAVVGAGDDPAATGKEDVYAQGVITLM